MLHEHTVTPETLDLIKRLTADQQLKDFALVGGTALALQLGHRRSIDVDLFTPGAFTSDAVSRHIKATYNIGQMDIIKNGVYTFIDGIKTDMISFGYPWLSPPQTIDGIRMASLDDIAAMKLHAIIQNGRRLKDFVDVHYLLEHKSLHDMTEAYTRKFPGYNTSLLKNALLYHDEINFKWDVSLLLQPFDWQKIDQRLRRAAQTPKQIFAAKPEAPGKSQKQTQSKQHRRKL